MKLRNANKIGPHSPSSPAKVSSYLSQPLVGQDDIRWMKAFLLKPYVISLLKTTKHRRTSQCTCCNVSLYGSLNCTKSHIEARVLIEIVPIEKGDHSDIKLKRKF